MSRQKNGQFFVFANFFARKQSMLPASQNVLCSRISRSFNTLSFNWTRSVIILCTGEEKKSRFKYFNLLALFSV